MDDTPNARPEPETRGAAFWHHVDAGHVRADSARAVVQPAAFSGARCALHRRRRRAWLFRPQPCGFAGAVFRRPHVGDRFGAADRPDAAAHRPACGHGIHRRRGLTGDVQPPASRLSLRRIPAGCCGAHRRLFDRRPVAASAGGPVAAAVRARRLAALRACLCGRRHRGLVDRPGPRSDPHHLGCCHHACGSCRRTPA